MQTDAGKVYSKSVNDLYTGYCITVSLYSDFIGISEELQIVNSNGFNFHNFCWLQKVCVCVCV